MSGPGGLGRLARMHPEEIAFRIGVEARKALGRVRHAVRRPRWRRADLARRIVAGSVPGLDTALRASDFGAAHRLLGSHIAERASSWPLRATNRASVSSAVRRLCPDAAAEAARRADQVLGGRYDLLGYRRIDCGTLPDWHRDPVHGRRAPARFWASVPYLDPACGDHKVTWELNRHQHWLALGRAYWLTGNEQYRRGFVAQLEHWLAANPPLEGINWASMLELAFRSISWGYAVEFFADGANRDEEPWLVDLLVAIDSQLAHVEHNLSRYFSPNTHLTGEALALYVVSRAFPELRHSRRRASLGRRVLLHEATQQVGPDGGHAERSAHYHRYSTDFYLLATMVARHSGDPDAACFEAAARAQAEFLRTIADDQGRLPLIGDDDGGQLFSFGAARPADAAPSLAAAAELLDDPGLATGPLREEAIWIVGSPPRLSIQLTHPPPWPSKWKRETGYFISRTGGGHLVFDAGPHGYLNGGHAHADALAITLSAGGRPVLVDPGTATYTMDPAARDRFRSPRMHNTCRIDGRDHVTPRGPFHWQAPVDARFVAAHIGAGADFAQGTHDAHLPLRHTRSVAALHGYGWLVVDHLLGAGEHELETWWHIHPDLSCRHEVPRPLVRLQGKSGPVAALAFSSGDVAVLTDDPLAVYAPEYGRVEPAPAMRFCRHARAPFAVAAFIAAPEHAVSDVSIEELGVEAPAPAGYDGRAFAVRLGPRRLVALVAAPLDGQARPWTAESTWGVRGIRTDARCTAATIEPRRVTPLVMVDGTRTEADASAPSNAGLASAVHG